MSFFAKHPEIIITFDKEVFVFGVDDTISGFVLGIENDEFSVHIETISGVSEKKYDDLVDAMPDFSRTIVGEQIIVKKSEGYKFQFPLLYPNIDAGEDSYGMDTFTYIGNFLVVGENSTLVPIQFENLTESRREARELLENIRDNTTQEELRYELGNGGTDMKEFFKKRILDNKIEPGMTRLPWNLGDTVNAEYYFGMVNSSVFRQIAHWAYLYNVHYYLYFLLLCYSIFIFLYSEALGKLSFDIYTIIEIFLIIASIILGLSQYFLKKKIYPTEYFLKIKTQDTVDAIFDKNNFRLEDIFEESQNFNNFLSSASGNIVGYIQVYFHFRYKSGKNMWSHIEHISIVKFIEKKFSSHSDILHFQSELENISSLYKKRKDLENIGVYVGLDIQINYNQYPDKNYEYNLGKFIH